LIQILSLFPKSKIFCFNGLVSKYLFDFGAKLTAVKR